MEYFAITTLHNNYLQKHIFHILGILCYNNIACGLFGLCDPGMQQNDWLEFCDSIV